jgi:hypothetical protein
MKSIIFVGVLGVLLLSPFFVDAAVYAISLYFSVIVAYFSVNFVFCSKSGGRVSGGGIKATKAKRQEQQQKSIPASAPAPHVNVVHGAPTTVIVGGGHYGYGPSCGNTVS